MVNIVLFHDFEMRCIRGHIGKSVNNDTHGNLLVNFHGSQATTFTLESISFSFPGPIFVMLLCFLSLFESIIEKGQYYRFFWQ